MGTNQSSEAAAAEFKKYDSDNSGELSCDQLQALIEQHEELWSMLQVNTDLDASFCKAVVQEVMTHKADHNGNGKLSQKEFADIYSAVIANPKGQLEFFHEVLFAAYDSSGDGKMTVQDLDHFLELFYEKGSIFAGDKRLPPKDELQQRALDELDRNHDGKLTLSELKPLLVGSFKLDA